MKIRCPTCGAVGTDTEPIPPDLRGPSWKPLKGEEDYAFAVHGRHGGRAVRKCLNCGSGVYVKLLPPRYQAIPPDLWEEMQVHFDARMAELDGRLDALVPPSGPGEEARESSSDPVFEERLDILLARLNEDWATAKNPLTRGSRGAEPGDLERALIRHIVRRTSAIYAIDAVERDAEPDQNQVSRETNVLIRIAAGGYLWRDAERELVADGKPLAATELAAQWTREHPSAEENERFEKLARAIFWTLEALAPLHLPADTCEVDTAALFDAGFYSVAEFALSTEELAPSDMLIAEDEMRAAFDAGVALRELEHSF